MREFFEEIKDDLEECGFTLTDCLLSILIAISFFISLWIMKVCSDVFKADVLICLVIGILFFFAVVLTAVGIVEKKRNSRK